MNLTGKKFFGILSQLNDYIRERKNTYITDSSQFKLIKSISGYEGIYDGQQHYANASTLENCIIEYSSDREKWNYDSIGYKNVSEEYCYIRVKRHNRVEEAKVLINIKPREITLKSKSDQKQYDGKELKCDQILLSGDGFCNDEAPKIIVEGKIRQVGKKQNTFSYQFSDNVNARNYDISMEYGTLEILPRDEKYQLQIHMTSKEILYDGLEHFVLGIEEENVEINNIRYQILANVKPLKKINSGEYIHELMGEIKIIDLENEDVTDQFKIEIIPGYLKINKRNICLNSKSLYKEYDGQWLENKEVDISGDGLVQKDMIYAEAYGKQKIVGKSYNMIIYKFKDSYMESNYTVTENVGTLTVNKRKNPFIVMIKGKSADCVYDGEIHEISGWENEEFYVNNQKFYVKGIVSYAQLLHIGVIYTEIKGSTIVYDAENNNVTDQFNICLIPGKLEIRKRYVKLKSESEKKEYNGNFLENHKILIEEGEFCKNEAPNFSAFGKRRYIGKSKNNFIYKFPKNVCKNDYLISVEYGTLEVVNRTEKYSIDVHLNSLDIMYDGLEHSLFGIKEKDVNVDGNIYTLEIKGEPKSAIESGKYTYDQVEKISIFDYDKHDVTDQFDITIHPGELCINKREVLLLSASATKEYDGIELTNQNIEILGDGFANEEGIASINFTGKQILVGESLNSFSYRLQENTKVENYNILVEEGNLCVVNRKTLFEIIVEGESKEVLYDGTKKELSEYKNLLFQINDVCFQIHGVSNVVEGIEEGEYQSKDVMNASVFDVDGNDVSKQFKIVIRPGMLRIIHNSELEQNNLESKNINIIEEAWNRLQKNTKDRDIDKKINKNEKIKLINRKEINLKYKKKLQPIEEKDLFAKLHNHIAKEFEMITLICEIEISDREFDLLTVYLKKRYQEYKKFLKDPVVDIELAVGLVQIGVRYYENDYWPQVEKAINIEKIDRAGQSWLGKSFYKTMNELGKPSYKENQYVTNILMHCFITDLYANKFFDFVYNYYRLDLHRDISNLKKENLEQLSKEIMNSSSKRENLLSDYVAMSVAAAKEYCEKTVSDSLKMIDYNFWEMDGKLDYLSGRMKKLFDKWMMCSNLYNKEKEARKYNIYKKQFKTPLLIKSAYTETFEIILPTQEIDQKTELSEQKAKWIVVSINGRKEEYDVYIQKNICGYETEEINIIIQPIEIFDKYLFQLFYDNELIHEFKWESQQEQFFNKNGKRVSGEQLEKGLITAYVKEDSYIYSEDIIYEGRYCGLKYYELNLREGSIVNTINQGFYIGYIPENGLTSMGIVEGVFITRDDNDKNICIYRKSPVLIINVEDKYFNGTAIIINGHMNKLADSSFLKIHEGRRMDNVYYYIDINDLYGESEGYNTIVIDYPNKNKKIEYFLLREFSYQFKNAPYVFTDTGILELNYQSENNNILSNLDVNEISINFNEMQKNIFDINLGTDIWMNFEVPMLLISWDRINWKHKNIEDVWYNDLQNTVYIMFPKNDIDLYVKGNKSEISRCHFNKSKDGIFNCDLTKLKSYFNKDKAMEQVTIDLGERQEVLFKVIQKSMLIDIEIYVNKGNYEIEADVDVIGKNMYFADLYCEDQIVAEKEPIIDSHINFGVEVETAEYTIKIYESDQEFGFDDEYIFVDDRKQNLINPVDLIDGCMSIKSIITRDGTMLPIDKEYRYCFFIEQISAYENYYYGILVATFHMQTTVMYASKALIKIVDINNPTEVSIKRITYENNKECFVYDNYKKAILDNNYINKTKDRYFYIDPRNSFCEVNYISPNMKKKEDGYNWIEKTENNKHKKFSIWKNEGE